MYSKTCDTCGETMYDDDMDRLIENMKKHLMKHKIKPVGSDTIDVVEYNKPVPGDTISKTVLLDTIDRETTTSDTIDPETTTGSTAMSTGFMSPVTTLDEAVHAFSLFDQAKNDLLRDQDVLYFGAGGRPVAKGTAGAKPYLLKSAWRRMARFFGLNIDIEGRERIGTDEKYIWIYRYRISHPSGAYVVSEGVCTSEDSFFTKGGKVKADESDVMLKAQTVAQNRGISDLLGSGEVSAEEMDKGV